MTDDLEPVTADGPQPDKDAWKAQYAAAPAPAAAPAAPAADEKPPLLASSATALSGAPAKTRPLSLAFLAAAGAALIGGLLWAVISVATGYNLGILAFVIGAATGLTAQAVAGGPIGGFERGLAGIFAAGAVVIGDYVIVIHEVRIDPSSSRPGYLDGHAMSVFMHNFGTYVHGFDYAWIAIAAYAAIRTTGGGLRRRTS